MLCSVPSNDVTVTVSVRTGLHPAPEPLPDRYPPHTSTHLSHRSSEPCTGHRRLIEERLHPHPKADQANAAKTSSSMTEPDIDNRFVPVIVIAACSVPSRRHRHRVRQHLRPEIRALQTRIRVIVSEPCVPDTKEPSTRLSCVKIFPRVPHQVASPSAPFHPQSSRYQTKRLNRRYPPS